MDEILEARDFDDITGLELGSESFVEKSLSSLSKEVLDHVSTRIRDWVLFQQPFAGVGPRTAKFHALWHDGLRELAPGDENMEPSKKWLQAVSISSVQTNHPLANTSEASSKLNNIRGDMARKAKTLVQAYYKLAELNHTERAAKAQWLLEKDRFTCPDESRKACFARPNEYDCLLTVIGLSFPIRGKANCRRHLRHLFLRDASARREGPSDDQDDQPGLHRTRCDEHLARSEWGENRLVRVRGRLFS
jgi:hypothetical protein